MYSFGGSTTTGANPTGNLVFDAGGNIYGVTNAGGSANDYGVVYSLAPANPTWTETILYTFSKPSGVNPVGGLTWNHTNNNLYGTTTAAERIDLWRRIHLQVRPPAVKGGVWTESTLFQFTYSVSGGYPTGSVLRDSKTGNLYGTAINGGVTGCDLFCGTLWQVTNP